MTVLTSQSPNAGAMPCPRKRRADLWALALILMVGVGMSVSFLRSQDIWVDETTQLSGLTLSPVAVVPWLCGEDTQRFGVPGDRMPPLSYWTGWLWSNVFGLSETSLRAMGVFAVVCAALLIAAAARKAWGPWAGVLAAAVFLFSPNTLVNSVEIRAYPLFLLTTAGALYFCVRILEATSRPTLGEWVGLGLCCVAGIYTHFYGVVLAGAVVCGLAVVSLLRREFRRPLMAMAAAVMVCAAGMAPFALGATQMGGMGAEGLGAGSVARFIYRALIGHPSLGVYRAVTVLGMAAFAVMVAAIVGPRRTGRGTCWMLVVALVSGCAAALAAKAVVDKFDALSPSYNLWRLPILCMLAGSVMAIRSRRLRIAGIGATLGVVIAGAGACGVILRNGDVFRHTPHGEVVAVLRSSSPGAVVYDGAGGWGGAYFPLLYGEGARIRHVLLKRSDAGTAEVIELPAIQKRESPGAMPQRIMLIATENQRAEDTVAMCRNQPPRVAVSLEATKMLEAAGYIRIRAGVLPAQDAVAYIVYERAGGVAR